MKFKIAIILLKIAGEILNRIGMNVTVSIHNVKDSMVHGRSISIAYQDSDKTEKQFKVQHDSFITYFIK
jgi:hypothetical protein